MSDSPSQSTSAKVKCASCATLVAAALKFCPSCGASMESLPAVVKAKSARSAPKTAIASAEPSAAGDPETIATSAPAASPEEAAAPAQEPEPAQEPAAAMAAAAGVPAAAVPAPPSVPASEQPQPAQFRCLHCGVEYAATNAFCPNCGTPHGAAAPASAAVPAAMAPAPQVMVVQQGPSVESKATTALLAEIIGGIFGFLGIGHIINGDVGLGIAIMFGWWFTIVVLVVLTGISGGICLLVTLPAYFAIPVGSGLMARNNARKKGV